MKRMGQNLGKMLFMYLQKYQMFILEEYNTSHALIFKRLSEQNCVNTGDPSGQSEE